MDEKRWYSCWYTEKLRWKTYISVLTKTLNSSIGKGFFPNQLKLAEMTPLFKKENDLNKENYPPVSVLSQASKITEKTVLN